MTRPQEARSVMQPWNRDVSSADLVVRVVLRRGGEVLNEHDFGSLKQSSENDSYLLESPVDLHGPEGDHVHVVHQTVGVRHLFAYSKIII